MCVTTQTRHLDRLGQLGKLRRACVQAVDAPSEEPQPFRSLRAAQSVTGKCIAITGRDSAHRVFCPLRRPGEPPAGWRPPQSRARDLHLLGEPIRDLLDVRCLVLDACFAARRVSVAISRCLLCW